MLFHRVDFMFIGIDMLVLKTKSTDENKTKANGIVEMFSCRKKNHG